MPLTVLKKILVFSIFAVAAGTTVFMATKGSPDKPGSAPPTDTTGAAKSEPVIPPEDEIHAQYAGSASCKDCHETAYAGWKDSNHGLAEREYREDMDKQAFSPRRTLVHGERESDTFLDAEGVAKILTRGLDNKRHEFPVVRVIGNDPLRQFLIAAPGGRLQTCDVSYDPHKDEWLTARKLLLG